MTEFDYHKLPYDIQQIEASKFYNYCASILGSLFVHHYAIDNVVQYLLTKYTEIHRHYHTIMHINYLFDAARLRDIQLTPTEAVAIIYHDVVYIPGADDNETNSSIVLSQLQNLTGMRSKIQEACQIIIETSCYMKHLDNPKSKLVLDLDLIAFAEPNYDMFYSQNKAVEAEFPNIPISKRIEFLKSILAKPKIYYEMTDQEEIARRNIIKYINGLTGD